jgi:hypothetical protein
MWYGTTYGVLGKVRDTLVALDPAKADRGIVTAFPAIVSVSTDADAMWVPVIVPPDILAPVIVPLAILALVIVALAILALVIVASEILALVTARSVISAVLIQALLA